MRAEWEPGTKFRKQWVKNPASSVTNILRGIGALSAGELAGERMAVAYETKDQEDEHSCFSDNTNADVLGDQVGIRRVYLGELPDGTDRPDEHRAPSWRRSTPSSTRRSRRRSTPRWPTSRRSRHRSSS